MVCALDQSRLVQTNLNPGGLVFFNIRASGKPADATLEGAMKGIECTFVETSKAADATLEGAMKDVAECTFVETNTAADATLEGAMQGVAECTFVEMSEVAGASLEVAMKGVAECTFVETCKPAEEPDLEKDEQVSEAGNLLRPQERVKEQREVLRDQREPPPEQRAEERVGAACMSSFGISAGPHQSSARRRG